MEVPVYASRAPLALGVVPMCMQRHPREAAPEAEFYMTIAQAAWIICALQATFLIVPTSMFE